MEQFERRLEHLEELWQLTHAHEGRLDGFGIRLDRHGKDIERLEHTRATTDQLAAEMARLTGKIQHLSDAIDPLRKGMYWFIGIVMGSVVLALMTLILRMRP